MVTDKNGRIFEDRRKNEVDVKKDRRKSNKSKKQGKSKVCRFFDLKIQNCPAFHSCCGKLNSLHD